MLARVLNGFITSMSIKSGWADKLNLCTEMFFYRMWYLLWYLKKEILLLKIFFLEYDNRTAGYHRRIVQVADRPMSGFCASPLSYSYYNLWYAHGAFIYATVYCTHGWNFLVFGWTSWRDHYNPFNWSAGKIFIVFLLFISVSMCICIWGCLYKF